ncbi:MAG: hypothetical protein SGCHY_003000 [Lobulomycetales sp.]
MMNSIDGTYSLESEVDFADIVQPRAPAQVSVLSRPVAAASTPNGQGSSTEPTKAEYKSEQLKKQSLVKYCKMHKQIAQLLSFSQSPYYLVYVSGSTCITTLMDNLSLPLTILDLNSRVTWHDPNPTISESGSVSLLIGTSAGDVILYDPLATTRQVYGKTAHAGKLGAVTCVRWVPWTESVFAVSFEDGSILTIDTEKEDAVFTPLVPNAEKNGFCVVKSSVPISKTNPTRWWRCQTKKAVSEFAFSPDFQHVAIASLDGSLRVVDWNTEVYVCVSYRVYSFSILDTYQSYFGGLTCVCWSPDGRFIVTGGQDDLITIWSFRGRIVARGQGHSSWITSVAFDPWRCTDRSYRIGSVGEDTKLCLWDFNVSSLYIPKPVFREIP